MEWLLLLIPIIGTVIMYVYFRKHIAIWEYPLPIVVTFLGIFLTKLIIGSAMITDTEYRSQFSNIVKYYEDWNERVSCRHPIYCSYTTTDSKGNTTTHTYVCGYHHAYDVDYHPEYWTMYTNENKEYEIPKFQFDYWSKEWNNKYFVDMQRDYHDNDGDVYASNWNGDPGKVIPITTEASYENKIIASKSVFKYDAPDTSLHVFQYPKIQDNYLCNAVLSERSDVPDLKWANRLLQNYNGLLGHNKQVHMFILIFNNKPRDYAWAQEQAWEGGNKNEFIMTLSIDETNHIQWSKCISWTPNEVLKSEAQDIFMPDDSLDLNLSIYKMAHLVEDKFDRKKFKDFDYLSVDFSALHYWIMGIIALLFSSGSICFAIFNNIESEDETKKQEEQDKKQYNYYSDRSRKNGYYR